MNRFLITGLPRSRTAWFSVVASNRYATCVHEPTRFTQSWDELREAWTAPERFNTAGASDHALGFQLGRIIAEFEAQVLIIERPRRDVERSLAEANIPINSASTAFLDELETALRVANHPWIKRVKYEKLNDYSVVCDCLDWLWRPMTHTSDYSRVKDLMRLNIQVERSVIEREAQMKHTHWYRP